jgi:IS30 family transposase
MVDRAKVGKLVAAGMSVRAIAAELGISHATVHRVMRAAG